jgi:YVTN family beta-propeller protein
MGNDNNYIYKLALLYRLRSRAGTVGLFPSAVAVDMYSNRIYVTNTVADTVSVIDGTSNRVVTTIPVGDAPRATAVNQYNHNVFVINIGESWRRPMESRS